MAVKATFKVDLKPKANNQEGDASIELDSRPDGLNSGVTEFQGGDTIYFLLHLPLDAVVEDIITNEGTAVEWGRVDLDVIDVLVFNYPTELEQRLSRTPSSNVAMRWAGKGIPVSPSCYGGAVTLPKPILKTTVKTKRSIGVLICTYTESATVIKLETPETVDDSPVYSIHGVVAGYIKQATK